MGQALSFMLFILAPASIFVAVYIWLIRHKVFIGEGVIKKVAQKEITTLHNYRSPSGSKHKTIYITRIYFEGKKELLQLDGQVDVPYCAGEAIRVYRCFRKYKFEKI